MQDIEKKGVKLTFDISGFDPLENPLVSLGKVTLAGGASGSTATFSGLNLALDGTYIVLGRGKFSIGYGDIFWKVNSDSTAGHYYSLTQVTDELAVTPAAAASRQLISAGVINQDFQFSAKITSDLTGKVRAMCDLNQVENTVGLFSISAALYNQVANLTSLSFCADASDVGFEAGTIFELFKLRSI